MQTIEQNNCAEITEDALLFSSDCSPYYVGPSISRLILNEVVNDSFVDEMTSLVRMISMLKLHLTYVKKIESVSLHSSIKCKISRFGHGYKAELIDYDLAKTSNVITGSDVH